MSKPVQDAITYFEKQRDDYLAMSATSYHTGIIVAYNDVIAYLRWELTPALEVKDAPTVELCPGPRAIAAHR